MNLINAIKKRPRKNFSKINVLVIALIFISCFGFSQQNEIKIRFIANAGLSMTDGGLTIYFDFPYKSGFWIYSEYDKSEITNIKDSSIFIFTHKHPDHYSRRLVRKLKGNKYGPWNIEKMQTLNTSIPDFSIQSFKTKHKYSRKHCSYLITWHNKKIFISGDTEHAEIIETIPGMDWAFLSPWPLMDAITKNIKIDAKMIGLYHIGPGDKIDATNPKILVLKNQGEIITIGY